MGMAGESKTDIILNINLEELRSVGEENCKGIVCLMQHL